MFKPCALLVGGKKTHSAVKTPILQMEKLRPNQVKGLAQASKEDRSFEEIRALGPRLGFCLGPATSPSDSWREAKSPPNLLAPTISLGSYEGPVGEKTVKLQFWHHFPKDKSQL